MNYININNTYPLQVVNSLAIMINYSLRYAHLFPDFVFFFPHWKFIKCNIELCSHLSFAIVGIIDRNNYSAPEY